MAARSRPGGSAARSTSRRSRSTRRARHSSVAPRTMHRRALARRDARSGRACRARQRRQRPKRRAAVTSVAISADAKLVAAAAAATEPFASGASRHVAQPARRAHKPRPDHQRDRVQPRWQDACGRGKPRRERSDRYGFGIHELSNRAARSPAMTRLLARWRSRPTESSPPAIHRDPSFSGILSRMRSWPSVPRPR